MTARPAEAAAPATYQIGSVAGSGVWLGMSAGRVLVVGGGLLTSIALLTTGRPALVAVLPVVLCALIALARLAGRPLLDWVVPATVHQRDGLTGVRAWQATFPTTSLSRHDGASPRLRLPVEYGRPRLLICPQEPSITGVVDPSTHTVTAVFDVIGVDRFPLLDAADRDSLIVGWGHALAVLSDSDPGLLRLQLIERAVPAVADGTAAHTDTADADTVVRDTIDMLATRHDCRLAVQWRMPADDPSPSQLLSRCQAVSRSLLPARLLIRPMGAAEISREFAVGLRGPRPADTPIQLPGPVTRRNAWSHVTTDDTVHRSFAIAGWPASPVTADWLAPLLLAAPLGVTRTVAIHLERLTQPAAARVARTVRAKASLDQRDRVRLGMTNSAAIDRAESAGVAMDEELAAGHRAHRLSGLVTLTGSSTAAIDTAAPVLQHAAAGARIDLRPLHGQHHLALAATLPLCRVRPKGGLA